MRTLEELKKLAAGQPHLEGCQVVYPPKKTLHGIPTATCEKCGKDWCGWALQNPEHQTCECGGKLNVDKN